MGDECKVGFRYALKRREITCGQRKEKRSNIASRIKGAREGLRLGRQTRSCRHLSPNTCSFGGGEEPNAAQGNFSDKRREGCVQLRDSEDYVLQIYSASLKRERGRVGGGTLVDTGFFGGIKHQIPSGMGLFLYER